MSAGAETRPFDEPVDGQPSNDNGVAAADEPPSGERPRRSRRLALGTVVVLALLLTGVVGFERYMTPMYDAGADTDSPSGWQVRAGRPGPEWASTTERPGRPYMTQRITSSQGAVFDGGYGYRMETRGSDYGAYDDVSCDCERAELGNGSPTRSGFGDRLLGEGADVYYGFAIYLPRDHILGDWQVYWQSKSVAPAGSPENALDVQGGQWRLNNNDEPSTRIQTSPIAPATKSVWHRFVIRIKYSSDYSKGRQEVWHAEGRDATLTRRVSVTTHTLEKGKASHARIGYYHSPLKGRSSRVFVDAFRAGRTFTSVAP